VLHRGAIAGPNTLPKGARNPGGCGVHRSYTPGLAVGLGYAAVLQLTITAAGAGLAARAVPRLLSRFTKKLSPWYSSVTGTKRLKSLSAWLFR
jgi:hypothetical protein